MFKVMLKEGVSLKDLSAQATLALLVAFSVYDSHSIPLVVTSVNDSKHMDGSLHYKGRAFDLRLPSRFYVQSGVIDQRVHMDIKEALGQEFDVLLEVDHIHVEYDPKEGVA